MITKEYLIEYEYELRQTIVDKASLWIGTPYSEGQNVLGVGVDSTMLICDVYAAAEITEFFDPRPYKSQWHLNESDTAFLPRIFIYTKETLRPKLGDIAVWKFGRFFLHSGILVNQKEAIHAYVNIGCVKSNIDAWPLAMRDVRFFSFWKDGGYGNI